MPIVNDDGRYVAWMSAATDLVADMTDANLQEDLFVRDMTAGSTALVSINRQRTGSANGYTFSDAKNHAQRRVPRLLILRHRSGESGRSRGLV